MSEELEKRRFNLAFIEIGDCLRDMGIVSQQGLTAENAAKRGGIAAGLERAAAHIRGKEYAPVVDPSHVDSRPQGASGAAG